MNYSRHAVLEVDLDALSHNIAHLTGGLNSSTKCIAMVKADAYGLGAVEISKLLQDKKQADYLAVAYTEEALELREAGISLPIMVLNTDHNSYDELINCKAEPSIFNFRTLNAFTERLIAHEIQTAYPIHIKLNTGMNRLGFDEKDLHALIEELADNPYVKVASVFSHFSVSDDEGENDFTADQFHKFNKFYERIALNIGYKPLRHISNSAAITRFPDYQLDMVRLGIGMYGVSTTAGTENLKNVATFKSFISQIRILNEGESVSYGRNFKAEKETKMAVISAGYADGIHRCLGNGKGCVLVNRQKVKIIGTICMDMLMVDVSGVECKEGDEVIIFGQNPSIHEVANQANTIPYEIITSVAPRVQRIYLRHR